ncbi:MAG: LacI family transcriptional regulator [Alphaproteobacteria bacterium]|nr:MAG: LacI family transcriptional regulator [Alphaproteobacteria bacterium]
MTDRTQKGGGRGAPADEPAGSIGRKGNVRTIADLARLAGVSGATVSRALNDSPLVNERTRRRIQELASRHRFRLNARARQLRLRKTDTVCVILLIDEEAGQGLSDPFLLELLGGIADRLSARGYDLLLSRAEPGADWWEEVLHPRRFDGAIIFGQACEHRRLNALADAGAPFVVWGGRLPDQHYASVGSDNLGGGQAATRHLIEQGCRRIGFLGDLAFPEAALRWEGYRLALEEAGLPLDEALYRPTRFSGESAVRATRDLIESAQPFDGLVAASDVIALGAIRALEQAGRAVPGDVAVVGYDDIPLAAYVHPSLTTVRQDVAAGGRALVDLLLSRIETPPARTAPASQQADGQEPPHVILPTRLIVRQSSRRDGAFTPRMPDDADASGPVGHD